MESLMLTVIIKLYINQVFSIYLHLGTLGVHLACLICTVKLIEWNKIA